jgi:hypothetical protein
MWRDDEGGLLNYYLLLWHLLLIIEWSSNIIYEWRLRLWRSFLCLVIHGAPFVHKNFDGGCSYLGLDPWSEQPGQQQ